MITITQIQQEAVAAELHKRRQAERDLPVGPNGPTEERHSDPPSVPAPEPDHVRWAKEVLADGWQAPVDDRTAALRILDAAGVDPGPYHAGREPDSAPAGARDVAAAQIERERAEADRTARKNYQDRGAQVGPADGMMPGQLRPESVRRPYLEAEHAAPSPQAEPARTNPNPVPSMMRGVPVPIALPGAIVAAPVPAYLTQSLSLGSPSDK